MTSHFSRNTGTHLKRLKLTAKNCGCIRTFTILNMAVPLMNSLMMDATFAKLPADFIAQDIPGLDYAWTGQRLECIAVSGDMVYYVTYPFHDHGEMISALNAIAVKCSYLPRPMEGS